LLFGAAAFASMRYNKIKGAKFNEEHTADLTILQCINSYTKEHPKHMYFPCPEMIHFLTGVDLTTKQSAGFKEHSSDYYRKSVVQATLESSKFGDLSQKSVTNIYEELV